MSLRLRKARALRSHQPNIDLHARTSAQSFDPPGHGSSQHKGGFIDGIGHDVRSAVSERYVNIFLAGDTENEVPLGSERTHCFCDLTFLRWLLVDKLAWNENPLCNEHRQLRRKYNASNLDDILMRTMDIILTYDIVLDLPELVAASKLWNDDFRSVEKDLATYDGPRDKNIQRKLNDVIYLLMQASLWGVYKRKEVQDLSRLTDAFAIAAMFRAFKFERMVDLEWDFDVSLFIYVLEHRVRTEPMRKAAKIPDTLWPTDEYLEDLIDTVVTYCSDVVYEPDYLDRLLKVRPKLDMIEDFYYMVDLDVVIDMLEEAQVNRFVRDFGFDHAGNRRSAEVYKKGDPDPKFLSSLLLDQVFGIVQPPSAPDALGYGLKNIDDIAQRLVDFLCNYDIDNDLEHIMSTLRRLRNWMDVRKTFKRQESTHLPETLQTFVDNLPSIQRYQFELRQVTKQRKADIELLTQGQRALLDENHGREKGGWANDAVAFLMLLNSRATSKAIYPAPAIERDLDVDHELRIMPPILRSYSMDEVCPSPALYFRMKTTKKWIDSPENSELVAEVQALLDVMELCPEVQSWRESRKQMKQQVIGDERLRHGKQLRESPYCFEDYDSDFGSDDEDEDWRSVRRGWARDMSFLVCLFGRKFAQVPRKADWSITPGVSFFVNKEIKYLLRIVLSYDEMDMSGFGYWLDHLKEIMKKLQAYERVPEWNSLKELVDKIEKAAEFDWKWPNCLMFPIRPQRRMLLLEEDWSETQSSDDDDGLFILPEMLD